MKGKAKAIAVLMVLGIFAYVPSAMAAKRCTAEGKKVNCPTQTKKALEKAGLEGDVHKLRHTTEHILTQAMIELYGKNIIMAMGPATDDGFYFDFDSSDNFKFSDTDFKKIEKQMYKIINRDLVDAERLLTL